MEKKIDCKHPGYEIQNGQLVCVVCGEPSPKARLVDGQIVPVKKVLACPHCGGKLDEDGQPIQDKALKGHETKKR